MGTKNTIQRKLMVVLMLTSSIILFLMAAAFFGYEVYAFRKSSIENITTVGQIVAANSTAALAFDSPEDAREILSALKAEKHIQAASIYNSDSLRFATYPSKGDSSKFPLRPGQMGFEFRNNSLAGFIPIQEGKNQLGTLFILSDINAIYERMVLYAIISIIFIFISLTIAYFLAQRLYGGITKPIFELTEAAKKLSEVKDYTVRVKKFNDDELGVLTDAFNLMLMEIESFNSQLEQKVAERTKELEIANKELESFSYSISHDLRAPLRTVSGFMQIFHEDYVGQMDEEAKKLMDKILIAAKKMGLLIDDILEFSRLGRKELNKWSFSMNELVKEVWDEQIKLASERKIDLNYNELPDTFGDRALIKQVWVNLISNAIKYTKYRDKATIEIKSIVKNDRSIYSIRDNGAGFNMAYYDKVFGVFQRLHSEKEFEGTGAGLAIVQRIIRKHGGEIWAEAEPDKGAIFYFEIDPNSDESPDNTNVETVITEYE